MYPMKLQPTYTRYSSVQYTIPKVQPRNLKGDIGSLFDPGVLTLWGYVWRWVIVLPDLVQSAWIIVATCFTVRKPKCVCDISSRKKGNTCLTKLLSGLSLEKQRYNNSPPYVTARWPPWQIPLYISLGYNHRYRLEIPESTPSLSRYGAPIGGIQVFPTIKITVIHQVCM